MSELFDALHPTGHITAKNIREAAERYATPLFLYDRQAILERCAALLAMPEAYGLTVRYAMKANSLKALLSLITEARLAIDASSLHEVRRAHRAGIPYERIMLTSQEVQSAENLDDLQAMLTSGLRLNVCSLRQLHSIGSYAAKHKLDLGIRLHPGVGSGETASRNTGDQYACFGIHRDDLPEALAYAKELGLAFSTVHTHIGSGADSTIWCANIDTELEIIAAHFPEATTVSFGGGFKEARMPEEQAASIEELGAYAKERLEAFYRRTGRKLHMEIEPGTFVIANAGYIVTRLIDKKKNGAEGMNFLLLDGGMELNTRPLLYASQHPFYVVSREGDLLYSDHRPDSSAGFRAAIVGCCCESGDSQTIDAAGQNIARPIIEPEIGDYVVIGGTGAYASSMSPSNYNSHLQAAEILCSPEGHLSLIRRRQTLHQLLANEL